MANDIKFYYSLNDIPETVRNGNVYFILDENNNVGYIKIDIENNRYDIKPQYYENATETIAGLMSPQDKKKLIPLSISQETSGDKNIIIDAANPAESTKFNFLKDILIGNSKKRVLTEDSIQGIEVRTVSKNESQQPSTLRLVKSITDPDKFILEMVLNLPEGQPGDRGKPSIITSVNATIDDNEGTPEVIATLGDWVEDENSFINSLKFDFKNIRGKQGDIGPIGPIGPEGPEGPQGPQGETIPIEFRFIDGITTTTTVSYEPEDAEVPEKVIYTVTVPRGKEGKEGRSFEVTKFFSSEEAMYAAAQITDSDNLNYIPIYSFILISNGASDPATGRLFYRTANNTGAPFYGIVFIEDISPVQPKFYVNQVRTVDSYQNANVTITPRTLNDWSEMNMDFDIPKGKPLRAGDFSATVDKNFGTPIVTGTMSSSGEGEQEQLNLNINFRNMGVATPIDIGNVTIDNTSLAQPTVNVSSTTADDGYTQLLDFDFKGLKGAKGDAADSFDTSNTGITAQHYIDTEDTSRRAEVRAETVNDRIQLKFNFYNMQGDDGKDGDLKGIEVTGSGNAITNISLDPSRESFLIANKSTIFASENYAANANNISSGVVKVVNGGTGISTVLQNAILIGNGTSALKTVASSVGALYSNGTNQEPTFGTLPVALGGTGSITLTKNAILIGNGTTAIQQISTAPGAFYSTGYNQTPQFGVLPIAQGGTGGSNFTANSVIIGNGTTNFQNIQSVKGAFYSTGNNIRPQFNTLPVDVGGTGKVTFTENSVILGNGTSELKNVSSSVGAFYSTDSNALPQFGTLPISLGGTGATTVNQARINLGAAFVQMPHPETENENYYSLVDIPSVNETTDEITYTIKKNFCLSINNTEYYAGSIPEVIEP